jgi:hypothetical protein
MDSSHASGKALEVLVVLIKIGGTPSIPKANTLPLWSELHLQDLYDEAWFAKWKARVPQVGCGCQVSFDEILETFPAVFGDSRAQFERGIEWHNEVNKKPSLSKPVVSLEDALTLWRHKRPASGKTRCVLTVATGRKFRELLEVTRPSLKAYAEKCNADFIELTNETELWWGFEKCRARHFVEQYDETLFVDADCVVNPAAPSIFGRSDSLAMHDDYHFLHRTEWLRNERISIADALGVEFEQRDVGLNSGVVYARREAAAVWTRPPDNIPQSQTSEQTFVEQSAFRLGYTDLDDRWNWQFYFRDFWAKAPDAWIVHFAGEREKIHHARKMLDIWGVGVPKSPEVAL